MIDPKILLESLIPWGFSVILWVQTWRNPVFDALFLSATGIGSEIGVALLIAVIYWSVDRGLGVELTYLTLLASYSTAALKQTFAIPRPAGPGMFMIWQPKSFSFPSGHAQVAVSLFTFLGIKIPHPRFRLVMFVLAPVICLSRIYLGAHYPQDVLGGLIVGFFWLILFLAFYARIATWISEQADATVLALIVAGCLIVLPMGVFAKDDLLHSAFAVDYSGFVLGASVGFLWERRHVRFSATGAPAERALRLVVGGVLLGAIYGLCTLLVRFAGVGESAALASWLRVVLIGFGFAAGAPWLFVKTGLCRSTDARIIKPEHSLH